MQTPGFVFSRKGLINIATVWPESMDFLAMFNDLTNGGTVNLKLTFLSCLSPYIENKII